MDGIDKEDEGHDELDDLDLDGDVVQPEHKVDFFPLFYRCSAPA